ncbi:MAG TPA: hypothetical protein VFW33_20150, partial [Gemmataceae bacterium]|nr:hypothetical protein [Gemmataceae bacterium]
MPRLVLAVVLALATVFGPLPARAKGIVLDPRLHHLRAGDEREWSDFPAKAEGPRLALRFKSAPNAAEWALRLRQQDVKQTWKVRLNDKEIARLPPDENDMVVYFPVPAGALRAGDNELVIEPVGRLPDDVRVGDVALDERPVAEVLSEATVEVTVREPGLTGKDAPVPCRLTVLDDRGALTTVGAASGEGRAVRPGVVYTADGRARFGLPAGDYTIRAGRGFAYGTDSVRVTLKAGDTARKSLTLRREVPTDGWVCSDT